MEKFGMVFIGNTLVPILGYNNVLRYRYFGDKYYGIMIYMKTVVIINDFYVASLFFLRWGS